MSGGIDSSAVLCQALTLRASEPSIPELIPVHHQAPAGSPADEVAFVAAIERQLQSGEEALEPHRLLAPVPRLLSLGVTLRAQVEVLRPNA